MMWNYFAAPWPGSAAGPDQGTERFVERFHRPDP
jgi:hypothetical protein